MESDPYFSKILPIVEKMKAIPNRKTQYYIHCSKINSVVQVFKKIPNVLAEEYEKHQKISFGTKALTAITHLFTILSQIQTLFDQCTREMCVQFMLSTKVENTKAEIKTLRNAAADSFSELKLESIASLLRISDEQLNEEDLVDLKRISQMLYLLQSKNREDAKESIEARFKSLKALGIETETTFSGSHLTLDIPDNLKIVIKHSDVKLGSKIGQGQAGIVYLGRFLPNGASVAVKVMHQQTFTPSELESFRREVFVLSSIHHPCVLKFYGYTDKPPFYILTEYMSNGSLFEVFRKKPKSLTPTIRSLIALRTAIGLDYLHSKGIIHRDLKSLNILLDDDFNSKICDFGMVRTSGHGPKTGMIGTAHWMAPEILISSPTYDERVDVYSFGIFMSELISGESPYVGLSPMEITSGVLDGVLRPTLPSSTPPKLSRLIQRCWAQNPENRPPMSKIISELLQPALHFPGTDEAEFNARCRSILDSCPTNVSQSAPIQNPQSNSSPASLSGDDPLSIVGHIEHFMKRGEDFGSLLFQFESFLSDPKSAEAIAHSGGCRIVCLALESNSAGIREGMLHALSMCLCASIYDVDVLKDLLCFNGSNDASQRQLALSILLTAVDLRFDFIISAPSFLVQLLLFLKLPTPTDQIERIINISQELLQAFPTLPSGTVALLFSLLGTIPGVSGCLAAAFAFASGRDEAEDSGWIQALQRPEDALEAIEAYAQAESPAKGDSAFIERLIDASATSDAALKILVGCAGKKRFAALVAKRAPFGGNTIRISELYLSLFPFEEIVPQLSKFAEFYSVCSYFVAEGKVGNIQLACNALRICRVAVNEMESTRLCEIIAKGIKDGQGTEQLLSLMAACYAITIVADEPPLRALLPLYYIMLFGAAIQLRMPAFLCISAFSIHNSKGIDYNKLVYAAAFYVSSGPTMTRQVAAKVINDHVMDRGVNLERVLKIFTQHFKEGDEIEKIAINAFAKACQNTTIEPNLLKKMSSIYHTVNK